MTTTATRPRSITLALAEIHKARTTPDDAIPTWRATRRLRALRAAGHSLADIAAGSGVSPDIIRQVCQQRHDTIPQANFQMLDDYYQRVEGKPVRPARHNVAIAGWKTPAAWDDIDDPDESELAQKEPKRLPVTDEHAAILREVTDNYESLTDIATAIGVSTATVRRIMARKLTAYPADKLQNILDLPEDIKVGAITFRRREHELPPVPIPYP